MAMTDIFVPDMMTSDDHLTPYPRAPPPSPEMQPRSRGLVFEIPASKFNGIGLDLRRDTFPLDEEDELPITTDHNHRFPLMAGSPQKRVCCSPNVVSRDHMITSFPSSSNKDSLVSSGFSSCSASLHDSIGGGMGNSIAFRSESGSHSHSKLSPYFISDTTPRLTSLTPLDSDTPTTLYVPISPNHTLSHSYDLHSIHAHLPHSFEATQLPQPRPTRSRTLDSAALTLDVTRARSKTLDTSYGEDPTERKRKVSIKRRNPEESEGESSLQFCFDYSYSSTGSIGAGGGADSDWVLVDHNVESTWPMEKKACSSDHPSSVSLSHRQQDLVDSSRDLYVTSPFSKQLQMGGAFPTATTTTLFQPSTTTSTTTTTPSSRQDGNAIGVIGGNRNTTPANTCNNQHFIFQQNDEDSMMDLGGGGRLDYSVDGGGRLDSLDSMECDQTQMMNSTDATNLTPGLVGGGSNLIFGGAWGGGAATSTKINVSDPVMAFTNAVHRDVEHQYAHDSMLGRSGPGIHDPVMRLHRPTPPTSSQVLSRHSCMEEYLKAVPDRHHGVSGGGDEGDGSELDLDTRLGLSKSL